MPPESFMSFEDEQKSASKKNLKRMSNFYEDKILRNTHFFQVCMIW